MFMQQQFTSPEFKPSSGRITYTRWMGANYIVSGDVIGEREVSVRRYHGVMVTEYLVKPDAGVTNLSKHVVNEGDVVELKPACPRCNGQQVIAIVGDQDTPCPECGFRDGVTF